MAFYGELVQRVARLAAEWMAAGFTHGVLNTDNMSPAGESFDYGPFAFLEAWDPGFTAACFDHDGLHAYGRQPLVCRHNLRLLQEPLAMLLPRAPLEAALEPFGEVHDAHYRRCLLRRLGIDAPISAEAAADLPDPVAPTLRLLAGWPVAYGTFFAALARRIGSGGLPAMAEWLAWRPAALEPAGDAGAARDRADLGGHRRRGRLEAAAAVAGADDVIGAGPPTGETARVRGYNPPGRRLLQHLQAQAFSIAAVS